LGLLIQYPESVQNAVTTVQINAPSTDKKLRIGFIGAGNFAQSYLLPPLLKCDVALKNVMTGSPVHAKSVAQKFGFVACVGSVNDVLEDSDAVFITTRHDSHADYVVQALQAGHHVFVEKPLAVTLIQLEEIQDIYSKTAAPAGQRLIVGFNRRYSKPFRDIKSFFKDVKEPLVMTYRVNAGFLPKDHWTQHSGQGGRIIGEACHFIDCMTYLTDSRPVSVYAESISSENTQMTDADNVSILVKFANGSIGTLVYIANGDKSVDKEYCEVSGGGLSAIMNNFVSVTFFKNSKKRQQKYRGDKGHADEVHAFVNTLSGKEDSIIAFDSLIDTTLVTLKVMESLEQKKPMAVTF
jgi:polar amino acid transport system substrate-binding protein